MLASSNLSIQQALPNTDTNSLKIEIPKEALPKTTEQIVKEYFKDTPVLANVASCESQYRQFNKDGSILRGKVNSDDVGVMQINTKYHLDTSKKLGLDIYTLEGNLAYGKYLYEKQGTQPWNASSPCWASKPISIAMN